MSVSCQKATWHSKKPRLPDQYIFAKTRNQVCRKSRGAGAAARGDSRYHRFTSIATTVQICANSPRFARFDVHGCSASLQIVIGSVRYRPGAPDYAASQLRLASVTALSCEAARVAPQPCFQSIWLGPMMTASVFAGAGPGPNDRGRVSTSGCRICSSCSAVSSFLASTRS
jgi:hypothetical protein